MQRYKEDTDTVGDPVGLIEWGLEHPGHVRVMSNEPNADDLANAEYPRFFEKCHDLISGLR